jgi:hypothetical protein
VPLSRTAITPSGPVGLVSRSRHGHPILRGDAEAPKTWELQCRPSDVETDDGAKKVHFEAFDPADRQAEVSGERDIDAGAGRGIPIHRPL